MAISIIALILCYPFDRARLVVHEITRVGVYLFYGAPIFMRWKMRGLEHVDKSKSYVIVINHNSMVDIPSLYQLPLNFRWVSKREVFNIPFFGQFLAIHGDIAIERGNPREAMSQVVEKGEKWISRGVSIAIFPEGTRSKDGEIHRLKSGAFVLAKQANVAILPVVMNGTRSYFKPKGFFFNWRNRVDVQVLPPVSSEDVAAMETKELVERVHEQMSSALEQMKASKC